MASETGSTGTGAAALREAHALEASPSPAPFPGADAPARPGRSGEHRLPWLRQPEPADERPVLAVIGNGMVGQRFCQRCVELGLHRTHRMVVFGEEALPAYDRVRLTDVLAGQDISSLVLSPALWYAEHDIDLRLSERVVGFDLARRKLTTQLGDQLGYDRLVLATGSRVLVPPIAGTEHPGVFVYRSAEDVQRIRARALAVGRQGGRAVVIGSGLLGIEAGQALKALGCAVALVESAPHLLARQLDPTAAGVVADLLLQAGFELYVGQKVERIELLSELRRPHLVNASESAQDTRLRVEFSEASPCQAVECGLVVLASGVQPRDELARQAGLSCPAPGGIQVDAELCTSDEHVFAIGECARFEGVCHGLVAPGNAMAEVLAERLAGRASRFTRVRPSTRLEVGDRQIVVLGDNKDSGPGVEELSSQPERRAGSYRRLVLRDGQVVGATAIGDWPDLPLLENAIVARAPLGRGERSRFARGLPLWRPDARPPVEQWPDSATVCACMGVSCGALRRAREEGHRSVEQLCDRTRAGSGCGSCRPLVAAFAGVPSVLPAPGRQLGLGLLSLLVLGGLVAAALHGPVALQTSVQNEFAFDVLWRSSLARQISGFSLAALCLITGTSLALRRRWRRLRGVDFDTSRTLHVLLGVFTLVGTGVHTGMRQGRGLDFALLCSLLLMMLVGATTSLLLAGSRGPAQGLRRWGARLHVWIAWPLPVLLVAHVVKTYFF